MFQRKKKLLVSDLMNDLVRETEINRRIDEQLKRPVRQFGLQELSSMMTTAFMAMTTNRIL